MQLMHSTGWRLDRSTNMSSLFVGQAVACNQGPYYSIESLLQVQKEEGVRAAMSMTC